MSAAEKVLERMRQSQSGYKLRDFDTLFLGFGFEYRDASHRIYVHSLHKQIRVGVPRHGVIKSVYARLAVDAIDRLRLIEERNEQ